MVGSTAQEGLRGRGAHPDLGVRLAHSLRKVEYGIRKTGARTLQKSEIRNTGLLRKVEYGIQTRTEYRQGLFPVCGSECAVGSGCEGRGGCPAGGLP